MGKYYDVVLFFKSEKKIQIFYVKVVFYTEFTFLFHMFCFQSSAVNMERFKVQT